MFSKRHYENLPKEYLDILPCFVCPAYIAFHDACPSAKSVLSLVLADLLAGRLVIALTPEFFLSFSGLGGMIPQNVTAGIVQVSR